MIKDKKEIYSKIINYQFRTNVPKQSLETRLNRLSSAIENFLLNIIQKEKHISLAYSGGVDSSLILSFLLKNNWQGNAYTLASREDYPDLIYSKIFIEDAKKKGLPIIHKTHILEVSQKDIDNSNRILKENNLGVDNYYMLMKTLAKQGIKKVICGDVVDELFGGYYPHANKPTLGTFKYFLSRLIPYHLDILDAMSSDFGISVFLPYGSQKVFECAKDFGISELVQDENRKIPIYSLAKREGIPKDILERRKYGLCSATD